MSSTTRHVPISEELYHDRYTCFRSQHNYFPTTGPGTTRGVCHETKSRRGARHATLFHGARPSAGRERLAILHTRHLILSMGDHVALHWGARHCKVGCENSSDGQKKRAREKWFSNDQTSGLSFSRKSMADVPIPRVLAYSQDIHVFLVNALIDLSHHGYYHPRPLSLRYDMPLISKARTRRRRAWENTPSVCDIEYGQHMRPSLTLKP